jgi:hypothetical protein
MRDLRPPRPLQVRQQIQLSAIVGPVMRPARRDHTEPIPAPTERAWDQVRGVYSPIGSAHNAGVSGDGRAL